MASLTTFANRPVVDYDPVYSPVDTVNFVYRIMEGHHTQHTFESLFESFSQEPELIDVTALVFGTWNIQCWEPIPLSPSIALYRLREKIPRLSALYIGDICMDEMELSWIQQVDWGTVLPMFPELDHVSIVGGSGLSLRGFSHPNLEFLSIEAHRIERQVIADVVSGEFPLLTTLTLWLGDINVHEDAPLPLKDIQPLFFPDPYVGTTMPSLRNLGLVNCGWIDVLLVESVGAPLFNQLVSLDLSQGILTDQGLEALIKNDLPMLKTLNIEQTYVQDHGMIDFIRSLGITVIADELRDVGDGDHLHVVCWE